jgi:glutathione S-transferase
MPTNLRGRAQKTPEAPGLAADIARMRDIWQASLDSSGGPFLLGDFSIADCMFFPVAVRFRSYGVPLEGALASYSEALFARPHARELEEIAKTTPAIAEYDAALGA